MLYSQDKLHRYRGHRSGCYRFISQTWFLADIMSIYKREVAQKFGMRFGIHHSFLPGFKGARPYQHAFGRAIKLTGGTDHQLFAQYRESYMNRRHITSGSEFENKIGYSRAVVDGDYVFVSGTTGYDYESMTIANDVVEQAEQCFKNIEDALLKAGSKLADVVRVHYIFPDRNNFEPCWPVLKKYMGAASPAATMFVAQLLNDEMKIEIEVTAKLDSSN